MYRVDFWMKRRKPLLRKFLKQLLRIKRNPREGRVLLQLLKVPIILTGLQHQLRMIIVPHKYHCPEFTSHKAKEKGVTLNLRKER